jgi:sugar (pentulose or hexulose) kinase
MLAGVGIGVFRDAADAVRVCERIERHVEHDPARTEQYAGLFERYRLIKQTLDPLNSGPSGLGEGP